MVLNKTVSFLFNTFCGLIAFLALAGNVSAQVNSSAVHVDFNYSFDSAIITGTGAAAEADTDYTFESPFHSFVFTGYGNESTGGFNQGDGSGMVTAAATVGMTTHNYPDPSPDTDPFDFDTETMSASYDTFGQSSTPGSTGASWVFSEFTVFGENLQTGPTGQDYDPLTFTFNYDFSVDMTSVKDAPTAGFSNGSFLLEARLVYEDEFGQTSVPAWMVDEVFRVAPTNDTDITGNGQVVFDVPEGAQNFEMSIRAATNSSTIITAIPEPGSGLITVGALMMLMRRRNRVI